MMTHTPRLTRKRLAIASAAAVFLVFIIVFLAGWYFASVLDVDGLRIPTSPDPFSLQVAALGDGHVTLRPAPGTAGDQNMLHASTWGLESENGYAYIGSIISSGPSEVIREFRPLAGQISTGDLVRLDRAAFPPDPLIAHDLEYRMVDIEGELGPMPAWLIDGSSSTWAIFVHGWRSNRKDAMRMLPVFVERDIPSLIISYRNDDSSPLDPSGRYRFGLTEWKDLEAAVHFALDSGAEDIVLVGFSMGGGISLNFMHHSDLSDNVSAMILDAPMLDFGRTVDLGASQRGVPRPVTWVAKQIAAVRFGVQWVAMNYLPWADELDVPVLLFHGDEDTRVPVTLSDEWAASREDLIEYHRFTGAQHVGSWNVDPQRYEDTVRTFLASHVR